jgi:predicted phosphodiesterase
VNTTLVGFAGDWHGNTNWALKALDAFASRGVTTIYQVGDFGLWPGPSGRDYLYKLTHRLLKNRQTLYVVLGNHEDYDQVEQMTLGADGWLTLAGYPAIRFAPRAHTWEVDGIRYAALGGAGSIDRNARKPGASWWPQEEITDVDVKNLEHLLDANGWDTVDVFLCHEAPAGLHRVGMSGRPVWFTPEVEHDCYQQRVRLRTAVDRARPSTLVHGHWHDWYEDDIDGVDYDTTVFGLAADNMLRNYLVATVEHGQGFTSHQVPY